jgi:hypothetical protein
MGEAPTAGAWAGSAGPGQGRKSGGACALGGQAASKRGMLRSLSLSLSLSLYHGPAAHAAQGK